jgi:hypothetical protein
VRAVGTNRHQNKIFAGGADGRVALFQYLSQEPDQEPCWVYTSAQRTHTHDMYLLPVSVSLSLSPSPSLLSFLPAFA